ncbi:MAG TPA: hypothetical protein VHI13_19835 [Candidatus Kapabacteria bacterium]|nr:hypothetical protein [Candidatus Kapabacteria bacterium]
MIGDSLSSAPLYSVRVESTAGYRLEYDSIDAGPWSHLYRGDRKEQLPRLQLHYPRPQPERAACVTTRFRVTVIDGFYE